ncbi:MerR family transcriptional regulator [Geodermatophilus sp. YIM 151500]|uniref:MerR family transcriptional regulator n=1 Tax=Geodermatophilus sp. YIM 151500 TaxID=2984531 RepID=UPI0021E4857A|nr:MerR family transcriptional regulator [Geodermatophilus sp. YIM 151500]MCV2488125.1 MerR family transcriptional regulator [Geodermatophilus sp. YIM 151500]
MTTAPGDDPLRRLDDPDFPALTMSQAAELLGVQAAFLRSLDSSGVLQPHRSPGGHRRYSRHQLGLAARVRELLDDGHSLASAEVILALQDELASARADTDRLRHAVDRLHSDAARLRDERDRARRGEPAPPGGTATPSPGSPATSG